MKRIESKDFPTAYDGPGCEDCSGIGRVLVIHPAADGAYESDMRIHLGEDCPLGKLFVVPCGTCSALRDAWAMLARHQREMDELGN